jgi:hypothetical protein
MSSCLICCYNLVIWLINNCVTCLIFCIIYINPHLWVGTLDLISMECLTQKFGCTEVFVVAEYSEVFLCNQSYQCRMKLQHFRDSLCLHHMEFICAHIMQRNSYRDRLWNGYSFHTNRHELPRKLNWYIQVVMYLPHCLTFLISCMREI